MDYTISHYSDNVQTQICALPDTLAARYIVLTRRMMPSAQIRKVAEIRMKEIERANT